MRLHAKWLFSCVCFLFLTGNVCLADETTAPIRIGATVSLEGKFQEPSDMIQKAFTFWADEVNQKGGILGRRVTLILYDDKSRPDLARALYKKLIEQVRVDLVFSPYRTLSVLYDATSSFNLDIVKGICQWADTFNITIKYEQGFQDGKKALPHLVAAVKKKNAAGLL